MAERSKNLKKGARERPVLVVSTSHTSFAALSSHANILLWFSQAGCQVPTKAALSLPFLIWTGEKKYDERLVG